MLPIGDENPHYSTPIVTYALIAMNVVVFLYEFMLPEGAFEELILKYGFVPSSVSSNLAIPAVLTIFTSMFLHADITHIFGNMLYLYIFGDNIEDAIGHIPYLMFYLFCGVTSSIFQYFSDPLSTIPAIGASGAISGVLGAYMLLYPRARVRTLIFLGFFLTYTRIPALVYLGIWFLYQVLYASVPEVSAVAYWAHVGGFLTGVVIMKLYPWKRRPPPPPPPPPPIYPVPETPPTYRI